MGSLFAILLFFDPSTPAAAVSRLWDIVLFCTERSVSVCDFKGRLQLSCIVAGRLTERR
jgi:hypothetical protein